MRHLTAAGLWIVAMFKVPQSVPRPLDLVVIMAIGAVLLYATSLKDA